MELELLTDIDMLLMVEKKLEEEYVNMLFLLIDMQKLITSTWKIMLKIRNHRQSKILECK